MSNTLDATGLTIQSVTDIIGDLSAGFIAIYGADINLDSNTPDGQAINIYATALEDNLELLVAVYNQLSLQNAFGVQVDNLVALNGIQRQQGSHTIAQVAVTVSGAVTLPGQDVLVGNPNATVFTVSDSAGNQYQLQTSHVFSVSGTATLAFAAVNLGEVLTVPNSITIIVTPFPNATSVNNPSTSSDVIGTNEETDVQVKIRQGKSFQLAATGPADTIRAQLLNTPGITDAFVPENDNPTIVDGVFGNGIQVIINRTTATDAEIAQVIYSKKTIGCAQTGTFITTGNTHSNNVIDNIPSTANMAAGQKITGSGIPSLTTISSVTGPNSITISNPSGTTLTNTPITITPLGSLHSFNITRPAGNSFTAYWFDAVTEALYVSFTILPINGVDTFDDTAIANELAAALIYRLNQTAFVGQIIAAMQIIQPNAFLTNVFVGTSPSPSSQQATPSDFQHYFTVAAAHIVIS